MTSSCPSSLLGLTLSGQEAMPFVSVIHGCISAGNRPELHPWLPHAHPMGPIYIRVGLMHQSSTLHEPLGLHCIYIWCKGRFYRQLQSITDIYNEIATKCKGDQHRSLHSFYTQIKARIRNGCICTLRK